MPHYTWSPTAATLAVASMIAALELATNTTPHRWGAPYVVVLYLATVVFAVVAVLIARRIRQHKPRLVFVGTTTELRAVYGIPMFTGIAGASTVGVSVAATAFGSGESPAYCAYVHVRNDPLRGEADARNVRASLRYTDDAGNLLCEIEGRWAHHPLDAKAERTQAPAIADLTAHGGNYKIDIGVRHLDDSEWFAWNDESRFVKPDLRHHPLGSHAFVDVSLRGSGVRAIGRFEIPNASGDQLLDTQLITPRHSLLQYLREGRCSA
jgi:hypothetical protein